MIGSSPNRSHDHGCRSLQKRLHGQGGDGRSNHRRSLRMGVPEERASTSTQRLMLRDKNARAMCRGPLNPGDYPERIHGWRKTASQSSWWTGTRLGYIDAVSKLPYFWNR
jgi:hypothetical protein